MTLLFKMAVVTIAVTSPVQAFTGEHIIASCSKVPPPVTNPESVKPMLDYAQCIGFVMGISKMATQIQDQLGKNAYCIPNGRNVSTKELLDIYTQWLQANPTVLERPAEVSFITAMEKLFPCT